MRFSFIVSALLATQALGIPLEHALRQREPTPLESINAYVRRQGTSVQDAVKAPDGTILPYKRELESRQGGGTQVQDAVKSPDGTILPYKKRDLKARQGTSVQDAVKAPDGTILPYKRELESRQGGTQVQDAVKSPDGTILPY